MGITRKNKENRNLEKPLGIKKKKKKRMSILKSELSFCKAIFKYIKN
jgi:hypothetical protein